MRRIVLLFLLVFALSIALPASAQDAEATPIVVDGVTYDPTVCAEFTDGGELSDACQQMIATYPTPPEITPIEQDRFTLTTYSFWRVGPEPTPTFDAPDGSPAAEIPQGFNFIRAVDLSVDGWIQIEGGRWIRESDARWSQPSYFTGVTISDGLEYPFAFVLDLSRIYVSAYPGGPRSQDTGRWIKRYEPVNIFATATDADGWHWYMIGPNQWVEQRFVAKIQKIERPEGVSGRWVAVDLYEQTLVAYEDDTPVYATLISSGLPTHETPEGLFNVWASLPADGMSGATGAPSAYALQSVPWVMYFNGGISLHGTYWHDLFGYRQSHGCVNLTISDAKWVYNWFHDGDLTNEIDNPVYVYSSGEYGVTATGI
ncbi:MAG: L,D-transpeptidase [Anaerolineae bacterium]|nr:L,D-transpeptidase [Anaerolineae bacterium]